MFSQSMIGRLMTVVGAASLSLVLGACHATAARDALASKVDELTAPETNLRSAGGPYATSDNYLGVLGIAEPSARVLAALQPIPGNRALLFAGPDNDRTVRLTEATLRYLAWPRQFLAVQGKTMRDRQAAVSQLRQPVAGVLYYRGSPDQRVRPAAACTIHTVAIGPDLVLQYVVDTENAGWSLDCFS